MSSVVEDLPSQFIAPAAAPPAYADHDDEDSNDEQKIGSVLMEDRGAGADIWAYSEDGEVWIEFRGWRSDGSWWCVECNVDDGVEETLKVVCQAAKSLDQPPAYIRLTSIVYSVDMPDCSITRSATVNQCIDFPDQRWVDVRDQEQWFDVHMVLRVC